MANEKDILESNEENVIVKNMEDVMHDAMMPYSEYVILDRALPRVEDGLKPVQRRILYTMHELGLRPDTQYRKCARVVGDCLGKYHPHGDSSVYGALARMAQTFNMGEVLIDGQGNFGSIDGDSPAAMRYTECRMAPLALELLKDLEKDTVRWSCNFDDTLKEPDILPGRFPNLLVNGASGIAVGLATNIPPHNLGEAIDGVCAYIANPRISLKDMMKIIKGPDFPGGCSVIAGEELYNAYETGRGKITMRAKMHIEAAEGDKKLLVIDELPYQVNKSALLESISKLRDESKSAKADDKTDKNDKGTKDKKGKEAKEQPDKKNQALQDIIDITDESDRTGMRAVIKLKKDADIKKIIAILVKSTSISTSFGINMVAIADGKPQQMGLLDIIAYYADYQKLVILRRSKFLLEENKKKEMVLLGLIIAVRNIDEVVEIIKTSKSVPVARERLKERFNLNDIQAQAILDLRLARLTHIEVYKLEQELAEIQSNIKDLSEIIGSKRRQWDVVRTELAQLKRQYKSPRKTEILNDEKQWVIPDETIAKPVEDCVVCTNANGEIKKMLVKNFTMATRECTDNTTKKEICNCVISTTTEEKIYAFTNKGNCFKFDVDEIPEGKWKESGKPLSALSKEAAEDERVIYAINVKEKLENKGNILFYTKMGMVKKTEWSEYEVSKTVFQACKLNEGDEVIGMENELPDHTLMFVTEQGICLNAAMDDIPLQKRVSGGVKGIALSDGDKCVLIKQATRKGEVVLITNKSYGKRVGITDIDVMARYRKGVKIIDFSRPNNGRELVYAGYCEEPYQLALETGGGYIVPVPFSKLKKENRTHPGSAILKGSVTCATAYRYNDDFTNGD